MSASQKPSKATRKLQAMYHPTRPLSLWQDSQHDQGEVRIEIVPLIDVIFCILTFFILGAVGLSRQQAISVDLPKASTGTPQMREMFVVSLDDLGQLYVEKQPVNESQMMSALQNYHQYNPSGLIVLHASRNASYNDVVQLLDILRTVGGDKVALATLPGESRPDSSSAVPGGFNDPSLGLPGGTQNSFGSSFPNNPPSGAVPLPGSPGLNNGSFPGNPGLNNAPLPGNPSINNGSLPRTPGLNNVPGNAVTPRFTPGSTIPQPPSIQQSAPRPNTP
ncbi:MAG: biopolymer transporter ExbD [Synechocystis sp.]|jgi:biopolymer transport protein ExbD